MNSSCIKSSFNLSLKIIQKDHSSKQWKYHSVEILCVLIKMINERAPSKHFGFEVSFQNALPHNLIIMSQDSSAHI